MAKSSHSRFVTPILFFVFILQASKISALDCYGCFTNPDKLTDDACPSNLTDSPVVTSETPPNPNFTTPLAILEKVIGGLKLAMHDNATCFTLYSRLPQSSKIQVVRYIYNKKPNASECVNVNGTTNAVMARLCFCSEDKCNDKDFTNDLAKPSTVNATEHGNATHQQNPSNKNSTNSSSSQASTKSSSSKVSYTLSSFFLMASSVMLLTTHHRC